MEDHGKPVDEGSCSAHSEFLRLLAEHASTRELRMGIDYYDGALWYGMSINGKVYFLSSGHRVVAAADLPRHMTAVNVALPAPLSNEGIERYLKGRQVDRARLLEALSQLFRSHARFQYDSTPDVLALWSLGTYLYMAFPTYPYIWINSATKQSGKSRVLELLSAVGFRNPDISINPTQAVVYRSVDQVGQVFIVDEFEKAKDDTKAAMIEIFNAGFRAGAKVPRCNPSDLRLEYFNAYCPKVFAGLNAVPDTLSSRSISIRMFPKKTQDEVQPFSPILMRDELQHLRDDMAVWALDNAPACAELVLHPSDMKLPDWLDDRAADFMAPLYTICGIAGTARRPLDEFSVTLAKQRHSDTGDTTTAKVLAVLRDWYPEGQTSARVHLEEVAKLLLEERLCYDSGGAGEVLRGLGFEVKQLRIGDENKKGVEITRAQLDDLLERYKVEAPRV